MSHDFYSYGFSEEDDVIVSELPTIVLEVYLQNLPETYDYLSCTDEEENPFFSVWGEGDCSAESESNLYDDLNTEQINDFGVPTDYYILDYSTNNQRIFGEDNDQTYVRKFPLQVQFELPEDAATSSLFGIEFKQMFVMQASIKHFKYSSTWDEGQQDYEINPEHEPQRGDIILTSHNNTFYEIIDVKSSFVQFLQQIHSYSLTVRVYVNNKQSTSDQLEEDPFGRLVNSEDMFDQTSLINEIKDGFVIPPDDNGNNLGNW